MSQRNYNYNLVSATATVTATKKVSSSTPAKGLASSSSPAPASKQKKQKKQKKQTVVAHLDYHNKEEEEENLDENHNENNKYPTYPSLHHAHLPLSLSKFPGYQQFSTQAPTITPTEGKENQNHQNPPHPSPSRPTKSTRPSFLHLLSKGRLPSFTSTTTTTNSTPHKPSSTSTSTSKPKRVKNKNKTSLQDENNMQTDFPLHRVQARDMSSKKYGNIGHGHGLGGGGRLSMSERRRSIYEPSYLNDDDDEEDAYGDTEDSAPPGNISHRQQRERGRTNSLKKGFNSFGGLSLAGGRGKKGSGLGLDMGKVGVGLGLGGGLETVVESDYHQDEADYNINLDDPRTSSPSPSLKYPSIISLKKKSKSSHSPSRISEAQARADNLKKLDEMVIPCVMLIPPEEDDDLPNEPIILHQTPVPRSSHDFSHSANPVQSNENWLHGIVPPAALSTVQPQSRLNGSVIANTGQGSTAVNKAVFARAILKNPTIISGDAYDTDTPTRETTNQDRFRAWAGFGGYAASGNKDGRRRPQREGQSFFFESESESETDEEESFGNVDSSHHYKTQQQQQQQQREESSPIGDMAFLESDSSADEAEDIGREDEKPAEIPSEGSGSTIGSACEAAVVAARRVSVLPPARFGGRHTPERHEGGGGHTDQTDSAGSSVVSDQPSFWDGLDLGKSFGSDNDEHEGERFMLKGGVAFGNADETPRAEGGGYFGVSDDIDSPSLDKELPPILDNDLTIRADKSLPSIPTSISGLSIDEAVDGTGALAAVNSESGEVAGQPGVAPAVAANAIMVSLAPSSPPATTSPAPRSKLIVRSMSAQPAASTPTTPTSPRAQLYSNITCTFDLPPPTFSRHSGHRADSWGPSSRAHPQARRASAVVMPKRKNEVLAEMRASRRVVPKPRRSDDSGRTVEGPSGVAAGSSPSPRKMRAGMALGIEAEDDMSETASTSTARSPLPEPQIYSQIRSPPVAQKAPAEEPPIVTSKSSEGRPTLKSRRKSLKDLFTLNTKDWKEPLPPLPSPAVSTEALTTTAINDSAKRLALKRSLPMMKSKDKDKGKAEGTTATGPGSAEKRLSKRFSLSSLSSSLKKKSYQDEAVVPVVPVIPDAYRPQAAAALEESAAKSEEAVEEEVVVIKGSPSEMMRRLKSQVAAPNDDPPADGAGMAHNSYASGSTFTAPIPIKQRQSSLPPIRVDTSYNSSIGRSGGMRSDSSRSLSSYTDDSLVSATSPDGDETLFTPPPGFTLANLSDHSNPSSPVYLKLNADLRKTLGTTRTVIAGGIGQEEVPSFHNGHDSIGDLDDLVGGGGDLQDISGIIDSHLPRYSSGTTPTKSEGLKNRFKRQSMRINAE